MATRRKGRVYQPLSTQNPPSFFKIYLPEHNSKRLKIPPDFIKDFNGIIPEEAFIKNLLGKFWYVGLEKVEGSLFIIKGWDRYVSDHSLDRGDLLFFTYIENSGFFVQIFGPNCCIKEEPIDKGSDISHVKKEEEIIRELPPAGIKESSVGIHEATEPKSIRDAPSNNLRFSKILGKASQYLCVPAGVMRECDIKPDQIIVLRNEKGDSQKVTLRRWKDRVSMGHGLTEFYRKNNVKPGDRCEFEVILGSRRRIKELLVKISPQKKLEANQKDEKCHGLLTWK